MPTLRRTTRLAAVLIAFAAAHAHAEVRLPKIFGSDMALQRSSKTAVWGKASPGEKVTAEFRSVDPTPGGGPVSITASTTADDNGKWRLALDLASAPDAPGTLTLTGSADPATPVTFTNVLPADVWLCGGQSNMEWHLAKSKDAEAEIAAANFPSIRIFTVSRRVSQQPADDLGGRWMVCSPQTVSDFSAVGYFFARNIWHKHRQPMGLISNNWGGTNAETWTSRESLEADPAEYGPILKRRQDALDRDKVVLATQPTTKPAFYQNNAHVLWDTMIHPMVPMTLKGVIWYQGESNASRAQQYLPLLKTMIADWRKAFESPDLPFYIVQLANFKAVPATPGDSDWAELREAQARVAREVPHSGLAVTFDIGEEKDIHPRNKQDVGYRLALLARKYVYGETDLVASGPVFKSATFEGDKAVVTFDFASSGLEARGGKLQGFALSAGPDSTGKAAWVWADAAIDGDKVVVTAPGVPSPKAVRYAWADNCPATLYNAQGLPATPFRSDDYPMVTAGRK